MYTNLSPDRNPLPPGRPCASIVAIPCSVKTAQWDCGTVKLPPWVCRPFFSPYFRSSQIYYFSVFFYQHFLFVLLYQLMHAKCIFSLFPDNLTYQFSLPRMTYLNFTPPKFHNPHQNMSGVIKLNSDIRVSPSPDFFTYLNRFFGRKFHCFF